MGIMDEIRATVKKISPQISTWRRDFHAHPEISGEERRTAGIVAEVLERLGLTVQTGLAATGVVGVLDSGRSGPTVALRADMDALSLLDGKKVSYASKINGACHGCGHDGHTAMLLGAATVLSGMSGRFSGKVKFIFQPSEEMSPGGAKMMAEAGVLDNPKVDYIIGLHLWPDYPTGTIGLKTGALMAATDAFIAEIIGKGGHGASPHEAVDAVVVAAQVILALQTIVSRSLKPLDPAVVSVGKMEAGHASNAIAGLATLYGTVRSYQDEVRSRIPERIKDILHGITTAYGAEYRLKYKPGYPAVINDGEVTNFARGIAAKVVGAEHVIEAEPVMIGEDFAYFLRQVPGTFGFLGTRNEAKGLKAPLHHPEFDIDEDALPLGVEYLVRCVTDSGMSGFKR